MTQAKFYQFGRLALFAIVAPLLFTACAQTRVVDSWRTDTRVENQPDKIAVIAVLPEALMRKAVEIDVAKVLQEKGYNAIPASNIQGMSGGVRGEIDTEVATGLLRQADVDGVVVMFYAGGGNSEGYVRSDYWAEYLGTGVPYAWGRPYFVGYTEVYTIRQGPGYADFRTNAYVESSFYDMETEKPVWRIVTFTKDTEYSDTADDIARQIVKEMRAVGIK
jgi:hypothetical protein